MKISLFKYELLTIETCLTHCYIEPFFEELEEALKHLLSYFLHLLYIIQILMKMMSQLIVNVWPPDISFSKNLQAIVNLEVHSFELGMEPPEECKCKHN